MPLHVVTQQKDQEYIVLIIDRKKRFSDFLAERMVDEMTVVMVSHTPPANESVIHVPFEGDIPQIPDGNYSHIFFIADTQTPETLVEPLLTKAHATNGRFIFVCDRQVYSTHLSETIHKDGVLSSIVVTGDIYDEKNKGQIQKLFYYAKQNATIILPNTGVGSVYPVSFQETIEAILHVGFGTGRTKIAYAFSNHPFTFLAIAHVLQKADPMLKIDFSEENQSDLSPSRNGIYLAKQETSLATIIHAFHRYRQDGQIEKKDRKETTPEAFFPASTSTTVKKKVFTWKYKLWVFLSCFLFLVLLPIFSEFFGIFLLSQLPRLLSQQQFYQGISVAQASENFFTFTQTSSTSVFSVLEILGEGAIVTSIKNMLVNQMQLARTVKLFAIAGEDYTTATNGTSWTPGATLQDGIGALQSALLSFEQMHIPSFFRIPSADVAAMQSVEPLLTNTSPLLPQLLGVNKKQTYLILFQNNMELRPSGGFIGSYAIMAMDKGKISDMSIHNVYDADGQLKGHIEPPFVIRRYIPLVHWYLRDSGFDVDFAKSAADAAFFLKEETNQQVDGVIAIDLSFVQQLITAVGPVYIPQYNQTVTAENFFLLTEKHAEKNTFAGSTQKQDFLQALFIALQESLKIKHVSPFGIIQMITMSIQEKHILFADADPFVQDALTVNDLSSSLWDPRPSNQNRVNDFTGINEANIGVNKDNYFLKRSVAQQVTIAPSGSVSAQLTVTYTNTNNGNWPGGPYKNYLRFILPENAILRSVIINGIDQRLVAAVTNPAVYEAPGFQAPIGLETERTGEEGKTIYGFLVTVPTNQTNTIVIHYDIPQTFVMSQPAFTYSALLFKQPGALSYPYTFSLVYPKTAKPLGIPAGMSRNENTLTGAFAFDQDKTITVTFSNP
ncbi:MAG TPA: DUF4012 domain-containing protein [Patescibacteria group bacterium]|nr:DUF4012 domain-containing protein [Patescibacteria group bacterium]